MKKLVSDWSTDQTVSANQVGRRSALKSIFLGGSGVAVAPLAAPYLRNAEAAEGKILKIIATDRGAIADFPAWADDTGNELLEWHEEDGKLVFFIKKGEED